MGRFTEKQKEAKKIAQELMNGNYVFLDTETTGTTLSDQVINMAFTNNKAEVEYSEYYKPDRKMNPEATAVSGITDEFLADKKTFKDSWNDFVKTLNGRKLVIYNHGFDETMIRTTCQHYHIPKKEVDAVLDGNICAMHLASDYYELGDMWLKMENCCHAEGINIEQNHLADGDVMMLSMLVKEIADPSKIPSVKNIYNKVLVKEDDLSYHDKTQDTIKKAVLNETSKRYKDYLLDLPYNELPGTNDMGRLGETLKEVYCYDTKFDNDFIYSLIQQCINDVSYVKRFYEEMNTPEMNDLRHRTVSELYKLGKSIPDICNIKKYSTREVETILKNQFIKDPNSINLTRYLNPQYANQIIAIAHEKGTRLTPIRIAMRNRVDYMTIDMTLKYYTKGKLYEELSKLEKDNLFDKDGQIHFDFSQEFSEKEESVKENDQEEIDK